MKELLTTLSKVRFFLSDGRGNVAMIFGLLLLPLVLTVGVGVDYAQALSFKNILQADVDAAALAGASVYTGTSGTTLPTTVANNYMNNAISALPANLNVTFSVTPATTSLGNNTTGYTVQVSATAQVPTSFMAIAAINSTTISVTATAENPVVTGTFNTGGFVSYACDTNEVYWYIVPTNGGVPPASAMNLLWSNNSANPPSSSSFSVTGNQKIGFAIKNTTGARPGSLGGCNYGNNMYGSHPGDTQWFYSSMQPPSASYNTAPGGTNTGTHGTYETTQDCSLVLEKGVSSGGNLTFPGAPQGSCYSSSGAAENINTDNNGNLAVCDGCGSGPTMATMMTTNAAPSCAEVGGSTYQYDWNDMGGPVDSYNYGNDMQYTFSCSGGGGGNTSTGVTLIQ